MIEKRIDAELPDTATHEANQPRTVPIASGRISAIYTPPPDKSIAHRTLFFAAISRGTTLISHLPGSLDVATTVGIISELGCTIERSEQGTVVRPGRTEREGTRLIDCGNSGTSARIAAGLLTGEHGEFLLIGDQSLSKRPMDRVCAPLRLLGAEIWSTTDHLPVSVIAKGWVPGMVQGEIEVRSAQVHASLVFAALRSEHGGRLRRTHSMRDHTLRLAAHFGAGAILSGGVAGVVERGSIDRSGNPIDIIEPGIPERDVTVNIPGDPSSAAFLAVAAMLHNDAELEIRDVSLNPTRTAFFELLIAMGGRLQIETAASGEDDYEPRGIIHCKNSSELSAVEIDGHNPADRLGEMIDELPLLALIGSQCKGRTSVRGAEELRLKESDRIAGSVRIMRQLGVQVEEFADGFAVEGPQRINGGVVIDPEGDHRLAMLAAVAGTIAEQPVSVITPDVVAVSYPEFWDDLEGYLNRL